MKKLLLLFSIIFTVNCYSQIAYEKGYFINNSDKKIDCLIKNIDWKNNPAYFEYKVSENSESEMIDIKSVKEFGIYNISKYVRKTVEIDQSSTKTNALSDRQAPLFVEETVFLKALINGKANLYLFEKGSSSKFFYNVDNSIIKQLIYKRYKTENDKIKANSLFKQQLRNDLKCKTFDLNTVKNLKYNRNKLMAFFNEYNLCNDSGSIIYEKQKRSIFNLSIRPRINNSSLSVINPNSLGVLSDYGSKITYGLGIEMEIILPLNKNKWAITVEPTYQQGFKFNKTEDFSGSANNNGSINNIVISEGEYKSIEIPFSIRHYFFITKNSKIYLNASVIALIDSKTEVKYRKSDNSQINSPSTNVKSSSNLAFGIGFKQNNKYSVEARLQTERDISNRGVYTGSNYKSFSFIFGYSIFNK